MPGRIVKVLVAEGDEVVAGVGLVIMEAMKMENELSATRAGVVRQVLVKAGDAVERDAVLLELA
jgi:biotin carboxyl carrier protein